MDRDRHSQRDRLMVSGYFLKGRSSAAYYVPGSRFVQTPLPNQLPNQLRKLYGEFEVLSGNLDPLSGEFKTLSENLNASVQEFAALVGDAPGLVHELSLLPADLQRRVIGIEAANQQNRNALDDCFTVLNSRLARR